MIDLYFWPTPNGWKITIMLEETKLAYRIVPVDLSKGEQRSPDFLKISPNGRMPAIIDHDGPGGEPIAIFESGAILQYLGDKTGMFYPTDRRKRSAVEQWLFWQNSNLGPMAGQRAHFNYQKEKISYALERYTNETKRLYEVADKRLAQSEYLAGDEFSIADISTWPWTRGYKNVGIDPEALPNWRRWFKQVGARDGVARGANIGKEEFAKRQRELLGTESG